MNIPLNHIVIIYALALIITILFAENWNKRSNKRMSKQIRYVCDGCEENLQALFQRGASYIELEILADSNSSQGISKFAGQYHFCNLDCLKKWKHLKSTIRID